MRSRDSLRVVIDTSSLVSYVLTQGDIMRKVMAIWRTGNITALSSPSTRKELADVLTRPHIRRLSAVPLDEFARGFERFTVHTPDILTLSGVCRDRKDDKFLACAVEGAADYLISSDRDLLDMRRFQDVAIVNPGQFLLAFELHGLDADSMAQRYTADILTDIQTTIPLDPQTSIQLSLALS
jgi:putative PIN family toxin of toxin-antitoxin system